MPNNPTPSTTVRPAARRTQAERREQTRAKLLDATIESLLDVGYAATTTRRVLELAGVSSGAQTHHFPLRVDLVGAAVERLAARRLDAIHDLSAELPTAPSRRAEAILDLLWADYSGPLFTAFVKLWAAADDDPELYARLVPVERNLAREISALMLELAGELAERPGWNSGLTLALTAIRGLALSERFEPRASTKRDAWPQLRALLLEAFEVTSES